MSLKALVRVEILDPINSSWYRWTTTGELGSRLRVWTASTARAGSIVRILKSLGSFSGKDLARERDTVVYRGSAAGDEAEVEVKMSMVFGFCMGRAIGERADSGVVSGLHIITGMSAWWRAVIVVPLAVKGRMGVVWPEGSEEGGVAISVT